MYYILELTTSYRGKIFINIHTQIIGFEQNVLPPFSLEVLKWKTKTLTKCLLIIGKIIRNW